MESFINDNIESEASEKSESVVVVESSQRKRKRRGKEKANRKRESIHSKEKSSSSSSEKKEKNSLSSGSSCSCGGGGDIAQPVRKKARDSCKSMSLFSSDAEQTLFSNVIWEVAFPMVNNRQATWKTVTLWVRVEEEYRHRAELLNMQPNNQVLNLYPWTKLVKFMKLLKCTCNLGGACQCPKPGNLPEVDGEGEPSASVSWANGVSLGSQVSSERRETVDPVLLGQVTNAVRQLRPSMTEIEYDKAKQAWNKEVMSGNLLNVYDFITEKNLRAKKRMTKVTMKRNFIR